MLQVSAALVNELRKRTGAGIMDCKRTLLQTNGDIEAAVEALWIKGSGPPPELNGWERFVTDVIGGSRSVPVVVYFWATGTKTLSFANRHIRNVVQVRMINIVANEDICHQVNLSTVPAVYAL
jgi:hypothetical protein